VLIQRCKFAWKLKFAIGLVSCAVILIALISAPGNAQNAVTNTLTAQASASEPTSTFRTTTRMVSIQVVATDKHGHSVTDLKADDFQVFERVPPKRERRPQKIAAFHAMTVTQLATDDNQMLDVPKGVYTNYVTLHKDPLPATIILVDYANMDFVSRARVRTQASKILRSIPKDIPVAVFLLSDGIHMLQGLTTDSGLSYAALMKATDIGQHLDRMVEAADEHAFTPHMADYSALEKSAGRLNPWDPEAAHNVLAINIDERAQSSLDCLRALSHYLAAAYPGRKNLLWLSSSFPIALVPPQTAESDYATWRDYTPELAQLTNMLANEKIAIYPINPSGLQTFADAVPQPGGISGTGMYEAAGRKSGEDSIEGPSSRQLTYAREESLLQVAQDTGGQVCLDDNDLGNCFQRAEEHSSAFYEISYYPDSGNWQGEFHHITVKTSKPDLHLAYRDGYFAMSDVAVAAHETQKSRDLELKQVACQDVLTSSSIVIVTKPEPAEKPGQSRFLVSADVGNLAFEPRPDGSEQLALKIAICTFNKAGKPLQFR